MKRAVKILLIFTLLVSFQFNSNAQVETQANTLKDTSLYKVLKHDGTTYIGEILSDDGREVLMVTQSLGKIYIPKTDIKSIQKINEVKQKETMNFRAVGPFTTRYHFTTNALPIQKGEDYTLVNLYGPEVHFSTTNRLSIGAMTTWIGSPFVGALKYTIPTANDKVNFGFGTLVGTSAYLNNFGGYGGLYWGMVTFGDRSKNLTFSAGFTHVQAGFRSRRYNVPGTYYAEPSTYGNQLIIPNVERTPNVITAPVLSVGAFAHIGEKASFVFDGMVFFSSQKGDGRTTVFEQDDNFNTTQATVTEHDKEIILFYIMPGMRFQIKEDRAFQIALAGATLIQKAEKDVISIPVPTCSWFFKF